MINERNSLVFLRLFSAVAMFVQQQLLSNSELHTTIFTKYLLMYDFPMETNISDLHVLLFFV